MTERPYTTAQLAERWQCSERHLRDLIKAGELEAFQLGRMYRIPAEVVREVEQCRKSGSSGTEGDGQQRGKKAGEQSGGHSAPVIVPLPSRF